MTTESDYFERARKEYPKQVSLLDHIDVQVALFTRLPESAWREQAALIHDLGGRVYYYPCDCDYAAAALERKGADTVDSELRCFLLTEAFFRAKWCVQSGTGPGEVISRARQFDGLKKQLEEAEPGGRA
jgi:hypothetical protein